MKKISLFLTFVFAFAMLLFLASCSNDNTYNIMFTDYDGSVLYQEKVKNGDMPSYPYNDPVRKADDDYTYSFSTWWPTLTSATEDKIYTAYYTRTLKQEYTVTFKNYDGSVLDTQKVKEGVKPTYLGDTPTKPHDDNFKYLFTGWNPKIEEVSGDVTYIANYASCALDKYMVVFAYEDNSVIKTYEVNEGDMASYDGEDPTMENSEESKYIFRGWEPQLHEIKEDTIFTAKFMAMPLDYTVILDTNGGVSASGKKVESFKTDEIKANLFIYDIVKDNYKFAGWSYKDTLIFDECGNALVDLDEIEFEATVSFVAKYEEEAFIDITYVAYNGVTNQILDYYKVLPEKIGDGMISAFYKWNSIVKISSKFRTYSGSYSHYKFNGWYEDDNLVSNDINFNYYLFDKDVKLECRFTIEKYSIEFLSNNDELGEIKVNNYSDWCDNYENDFYYEQKLIAVARSKSNIKFLGWYDLWGGLVTDDLYCVFEAGDTPILTAKWDYFKITYSYSKGTENDANPEYYKHQQEILLVYHLYVGMILIIIMK